MASIILQAESPEIQKTLTTHGEAGWRSTACETYCHEGQNINNVSLGPMAHKPYSEIIIGDDTAKRRGETQGL